MKHQMIAVALVSVFACLFVGCSSGDSSTRHVSDAGTAGEDSESSPGKSGGNSGSSGENSDFQDGGSSGASGEQSISGGGSDLSDGGSLSGGGNDFSGGGSSVAGESNVAGSGDAGSGGSAGENVGGTTGVGGSSACTSIPLPEPSGAEMMPFSCTELVRDTAFDSFQDESWYYVRGVLTFESGEIFVVIDADAQDIVVSYDPTKDEWGSTEISTQENSVIKGSPEKGIWIVGRSLDEAPFAARREDGVWVEHSEGFPDEQDVAWVSDVYVVSQDEAYAIVEGYVIVSETEDRRVTDFHSSIYRWDGRSWSDMGTPYDPDEELQLMGLWGDGSSSFVVVGGMEGRHIFRYDGCSFKDYTEYLPAGSFIPVSVSGNADGEIYATGMGYEEDEDTDFIFTTTDLVHWTTSRFSSIGVVARVISPRRGAAIVGGSISGDAPDGTPGSNAYLSIESEGVFSEFTPVDGDTNTIVRHPVPSLVGDKLVIVTESYEGKMGIYRATCR